MEEQRQTPGVMYQRQEVKCPLCGFHFMARSKGRVICLMKINDKYCPGSFPARREEDKLIKELQTEEEGW